MPNDEKLQRINEIKEKLGPFCDHHLNEELTGYVMKLCDKIGRKRTLSITRGRPEIWAAAIVHVIARLNFLFDKLNPLFLTADTIADYFKAKKSTVGNKASLIEEACNIGLGEEGFCSPHISDMFLYYETPEGFIIPKSMYDRMTGISITDDKETEERKAFLAEQRQQKEREAEERRVRRDEIKREIAAKKRAEKYKNQTDIFGDTES